MACSVPNIGLDFAERINFGRNMYSLPDEAGSARSSLRIPR